MQVKQTLYLFSISKNLLINSQEGDLLFLLYSGHGSYTLDINNNELTGYDQVIIHCDLKFILDDELKQIIQTNLKKNVTLFAMFDSCFSGSVLDLKYQYLDSLNYDNYTENNKDLKEVELSITLDNTLKPITLKKPNEVYYKIYKEAKDKAKQAKKQAAIACLEAMNIKNKYMLDDLDESDTDIDEESYEN
jgi:hypothetical protein